MNDSFNSDHNFAHLQQVIVFAFLRNTPRLTEVVSNGRNMCKDRQVFTEEILAIFDIFKPPRLDKQS